MLPQKKNEAYSILGFNFTIEFRDFSFNIVSKTATVFFF